MSATDIKQSIADMDQTPSGLIEASTLEPVLVDMTDLSASLGVAECADVTELQNLSPSDAQKAFVIGVGFFIYQTPAPGTIPAGSYAANDGTGYWLKSNLAQLAALLDVVISNPQNAQVLKYNTSSGKWENGNQTITALAYSALTGLPAPLAAMSATDLLVKVITTGGNKNLGTAALGNSNIGLFPNGTSLTNSLRSIVLAPQLIPYMTNVTDSVVVTTQAALRGANTTPFTVTRCIIIGDVGDIGSFFVSDALTDLVIIGQNGSVAFTKTAAGLASISGAAISLIAPVNTDDLSVGGLLNIQDSVQASFLPVFASNAAASSLATGTLYRTATGEVRVKY